MSAPKPPRAKHNYLNLPQPLYRYNVPSTQKEDADGFGEPSEFMAFSLEAEGGAGTMRAGQRVGWAWGQVALTKPFSAPCLGLGWGGKT